MDPHGDKQGCFMRRARIVPRFWVFAAAVLLPACLAYFLPAVFKETLADSLSFARAREGFFPLIHFASNSVSAWRLDPLCAWFLERAGVGAFFATLVTILAAGMACCYYEVTDRESSLFAAFAAALAASAMVLLFGYDTALFGALAWFPWLFYVVLLQTREGRTSPAYALITLFFVFRLAKSANQFALPLAFLLLLLAWQWARERHTKMPRLLPILVLLPLLYAAARVPFPELPRYPAHARVLEQRVPLLAGSDAFIGKVPAFQVTPVQILDHAFVRERMEPLAFTLLIIALVVIIDVWRRAHHGERFHGGLYGTACIAALVALADTSAADPAWTQLMPLYSLTRLFPGLGLFALVYVGLALTIFFIGAALVRSGAADLMVLLLLALLLPLRLEGWTARPFALKSQGAAPWLELQQASVSDAERHYRERVLNSPSYALVYEQGPHFFERQHRAVPAFEMVSLQKIPHTLEASTGVEALNEVIATSRGRWSSGGGRQRGGEWIGVSLVAPQALCAIQIENESFPTDFPRGLEVAASPDCREAARVIAARPKWRGELRFTDDGFPYRDAEGNVKLVLDAPVPAQCLRLTQTGASDFFEWSVTGIGLGICR